MSEEKSAASAESPMREADQPRTRPVPTAPSVVLLRARRTAAAPRTARQALKRRPAPAQQTHRLKVNTTAPVLSWVESLGTNTASTNTMLRFTPSQHNAIDLTEANASGMMQLLGGRHPTLHAAQ